MNDLKYVILVPDGMNLKGARAVIFNGWINHCDMVPKGCEVVSAGFATFVFNKTKGKLQVKCYGKSTSLDIECNPSFDRDIVAKTLTRTLPQVGIYGDDDQSSVVDELLKGIKDLTDKLRGRK